MACPILSQLESRGAPGNSVVAAARVRAPRRRAIGPENTITAFDRGLTAGADGLELDVHLSRDGIVVVHHDATLDRTTSARGPLKERTAAELAGFDVPALGDVLARHPNIGIIVELKEAGPALATAVVGEVRRAGAMGRVCLGSFSLSALRAARAASPGIITSGARFEVRMALYKSWCGLSPGRVRVPGFSSSRNQRINARGVAAIRQARAQSRHRGACVDRR